MWTRRRILRNWGMYVVLTSARRCASTSRCHILSWNFPMSSLMSTWWFLLFRQFLFFFFSIKRQSGLLLKEDNYKSIAEMSNPISLPPVTLSGKRLQRSCFLFVKQTTYSRWMCWNFWVVQSFFCCLIALQQRYVCIYFCQ